ncbi:MAG: SPOR domain-containing protein [Rhodoferax sp.]|nr:SPOR domain-containing protein [Rhodoferax sp.]
MLRLIVLLLMLLNLGYLAWSEGWLRGYGWAPVQQHEPERMAQQINPQALSVLTKSSAPSSTKVATVASAPTTMRCLQSNDLDVKQADLLRPLLASQFTPDAWRLDERLSPPRWMLYLGKFANQADQAKKRTQLTALKVKFEMLEIAELVPGFSLGLYATPKAANDALTALSRRGLRAVKVAQVQAPSAGYRLRLDLVSPTQASVQALRDALPELLLQNCADALAQPAQEWQ